MRLDLHDLRAGGTPQFVHLARCYFGRLHQPGPPAWGVGAQERQPSSIAGCIAICICGSLCDHPSCIVLCKSQCLAGPLIVVALSRDADEHRERQQSLWKLVVCWLWCVLLGGPPAVVGRVPCWRPSSRASSHVSESDPAQMLLCQSIPYYEAARPANRVIALYPEQHHPTARETRHHLRC